MSDTVSVHDRQLCCPACGSTSLATTEDLSGSAYGEAFENLAGERSFEHDGYTEVHYGTSESTGVECRACGWEQESANDGPALNELKVVGASELNPWAANQEAARIITEDRVPADVVEKLIHDYGYAPRGEL